MKKIVVIEDDHHWCNLMEKKLHITFPGIQTVMWEGIDQFLFAEKSVWSDADILLLDGSFPLVSLREGEDIMATSDRIRKEFPEIHAGYHAKVLSGVLITCYVRGIGQTPPIILHTNHMRHDIPADVWNFSSVDFCRKGDWKSLVFLMGRMID